MSSPTDKLRVVIADDERPARSFLASILRKFDDVEVVGEAANGMEAVTLIETRRPDLALLDYRLPGIDGVGIARAIKSDSPNTQIVMFTAYDEMSLSVDATRAGVFAFLVKGCPPSLILQALERAWEFKQELEAVAASGPKE